MKKRIALAAVAALAGGLLVAAPASAVGPTETDTLTSGYVYWDGATVAGPSNFVNLSVNETATNSMAGARVEITGSTILGVTDASNAITATQVSSTVAIIGAGALGSGDTIKIGVTAYGTITANIYWGVSTGVFSATPEVATFVVAPAPAAAAYNHTTVGAFSDLGLDYYLDGSGNLFAPKGTLNSPASVSSFTVTQYTSSTDDTPSVDGTANVKAVTVSLSGVGVLSDSSNPNATYLAYSAGTNAVKTIGVKNDGRSGVATITISVDGTVVKTKTVTFYGAVAKYTASVDHAQIQANNADKMILTVKAVDANGIAVPALGYTTSLASNDTTTVSNTTGTVVGVETFTVTANAKYARTFTVGNGSAETATVVANFVTKGVATVAIAADAATYAPGAKATFTLTAKNSDGVVAGDATYDLTTSGSTALFGIPATVAVVNGVGTFTAFMPVVQGPVVVTAALGTPASATASATVAVVDAAAAAQAAAITALQTSVATLTTTVASLVASMTAQIKVINATMLKIQKAIAALRLQLKKK